jgi:hypothetical protein
VSVNPEKQDPCKFPDCPREAKQKNLPLCGRHWNAVPYSLRTAFTATYGAYLSAMMSGSAAKFTEATKNLKDAETDVIVAATKVAREPGRLR